MGSPADDRDRRLVDDLGLDGPLVVADVGSNPLEPPPYARLLELGACRVVGFEPQPEAYAALQDRDPAREVHLPHALGRPGPAHLNVYASSGFASLHDVDSGTVELVGSQSWREGTRLVERLPVECTALDDVPDLPELDLLKIDVQGSELDVFRSGRRVLRTAFCVVPEVSFFPLYRDAPSLAETHQELVAQGFLLHKFLFQKAVHLSGSQSGSQSGSESGGEAFAATASQLVDGDAVYLRDLRTLGSWPDERLRKLVLVATFVSDSPDVAVLALDELVRRGRVPDDLPRRHATAYA